MPAATRKGVDATGGHSCFPPQLPTQGSPDVITNGQPQVRVGDTYANHACPSSPEHIETPKASIGSSTVIVNGQPLHRIGDAISCGDVSAAGSPNVFVGDFVGVLPPEYSEEATFEIRKEAGREAPLDDPETIIYVPSTFPPDNAPAPSPVPVEEPVVETEKTTISTTCFGGEIVISDSLILTPNFTLGSLSSQTLFKHKVRDQAGFTLPDIVCNLKAVAENILEPLLLKYPNIRINSGFRTVTSGKSQHEKGMAVDLQWPGLAPSGYMPIAKWCVDHLPFDQIIFEHGNTIWLHISYNRIAANQRGKVMTMFRGGYEPGLKLYY